jgi:simple sugar transport system permease protein
MNGSINILDPIFLNSVFRFVTPILFAALGGLLCDRVGIVNIALEGQMVMGCFGAILGSYYLQNALLGVLVGILFSMVSALIFAFLRVNFGADEIIVGLAVNLLGTSLTTFLLRSIFQVTGSFASPDIIGLENIRIPLLHYFPVLESLLSDQTILVYFSWVCVIFIYFILFNTTLGLQMRGIGENPKAATTLGVNVKKTQYVAILACGALCGLAGAQLSLGNVVMFVEEMSGGRGWIAIVATLLGQAHPIGVFLSSTLFGFVSSLSFRIQGLGWPQEFTEMLPYVITIISLVIVYILQDSKFKKRTKDILQHKEKVKTDH